MDYVSLGYKIRYRRQQLMLTQERLADRARISSSFLGHIERGSRKASIETIVAIANGLRCGLDILLGDDLVSTIADIEDLTPAKRHFAVAMFAALDDYMFKTAK